MHCKLDVHKMVVALSMISIMATTTLASAQEEAALSEGERHGLAACLVKCPDGDKACTNRCISKSQTRGVVWSDGVRACIRGCRNGYQFSQVAGQRWPMRYLVVWQAALIEWPDSATVPAQARQIGRLKKSPRLAEMSPVG
jgi:hypothetical protein